MKLQMVLISIIGLLLVSCGKSNENEYAISRVADMRTVYGGLPANSEVANSQQLASPMAFIPAGEFEIGSSERLRLYTCQYTP